MRTCGGGRIAPVGEAARAAAARDPRTPRATARGRRERRRRASGAARARADTIGRRPRPRRGATPWPCRCRLGVVRRASGGRSVPARPSRSVRPARARLRAGATAGIGAFSGARRRRRARRGCGPVAGLSASVGAASPRARRASALRLLAVTASSVATLERALVHGLWRAPSRPSGSGPAVALVLARSDRFSGPGVPSRARSAAPGARRRSDGRCSRLPTAAGAAPPSRVASARRGPARRGPAAGAAAWRGGRRSASGCSSTARLDAGRAAAAATRRRRAPSR